MMIDKKNEESCTCSQDLWKYLPAELRPKPKKTSSLRKATCPSCGKISWTNRKTDYCFDCDKET